MNDYVLLRVQGLYLLMTQGPVGLRKVFVPLGQPCAVVLWFLDVSLQLWGICFVTNLGTEHKLALVLVLLSAYFQRTIRQNAALYR